MKVWNYIKPRLCMLKCIKAETSFWNGGAIISTTARMKNRGALENLSFRREGKGTAWGYECDSVDKLSIRVGRSCGRGCVIEIRTGTQMRKRCGPLQQVSLSLR